VSERVQEKKVSVISAAVSRQAKKRLFKGLERFANTGNSLEEYRALGKGWQDFWPLDSRDEHWKPLLWVDSGHALFSLFRDSLRCLWASDPSSVHSDETRVEECPLHVDALSFLLGIGGQFRHLAKEGGRRDLHPRGIVEAWEVLRRNHPDVRVIASPVVYPHWRRGEFTYIPENDFQRAVYLLFRESWRAKVCANCSTCFIAEKPAQLYCSVQCSSASHRTAALKWWREKGAKARVERASLNLKGRKRK
jgi:hypothetical protein